MASFLERYHERTKYDPRTLDRAGRVDWSTRPSPWKEISGTERIDIRPHLGFLGDVVNDRLEEWSNPTPNRFHADALARISWFSSGVSAMSGDQEPHLYRTAPSAGGLYPVELYWIVLDVPGMDAGIWHFHAPGFSLVPVWKGAFGAETRSALLGAPQAEGAKAVAVLTGIFSRGSWRYGERAYRRMLLDAGHTASNLLLASEREGVAAAPLSGFADGLLSDLLFPEPDEVPLLAVVIGGKESPDWPRSIASPPSLEIPADIAEGEMQRVCHEMGRLWVGCPVDPPSGAPIPAEIQGGLALGAGTVLRQLTKAAVERRSCREFTGAKIGFQDFSRLARHLQVPPRQELTGGSLRTWLVVLAVDGVEPGTYRFDPGSGSLVPVKSGDFRAACHEFCLGQDLARDAAFLVVHTADLADCATRQGERAYRPLCLEAGMAGERLNLAAQALGLGESGIGGYYDDLVNAAIGQELSEAILYVSAVGVPGG